VTPLSDLVSPGCSHRCKPSIPAFPPGSIHCAPEPGGRRAGCGSAADCTTSRCQTARPTRGSGWSAARVSRESAETCAQRCKSISPRRDVQASKRQRVVLVTQRARHVVAVHRVGGCAAATACNPRTCHCGLLHRAVHTSAQRASLRSERTQRPAPYCALIRSTARESPCPSHEYRKYMATVRYLPYPFSHRGTR